MPPENKTRELIHECYEQIAELTRLVSRNPNIDQRQAFIEMQYSLIGGFERSLSFDNDSVDSGNDVESDDEEDVKILTSKLASINAMIVSVKNELANYEKVSSEAKVVLARLVPECTMALKELDFMASFYPENTFPWDEFKENLRRDLAEHQRWNIEDQIFNFKTIAVGCKTVLAAAREHFLRDENKLVDPAIQKHALLQFNELWKQLKQFKTREANRQLYKLGGSYKYSKQLEPLFRSRATSQIHLASYRKSIAELQVKKGCMPFNFGFKAYLQARSTHTEGIQESNNAQIIKACQSLLDACLKMKQYVLTHAPHETVAIVPVTQFTF